MHFALCLKFLRCLWFVQGCQHLYALILNIRDREIGTPAIGNGNRFVERAHTGAFGAESADQLPFGREHLDLIGIKYQHLVIRRNQ